MHNVSVLVNCKIDYIICGTAAKIDCALDLYRVAGELAELKRLRVCVAAAAGGVDGCGELGGSVRDLGS